MLFGYADCHFRTMSIVINANVFDVGQVVQKNEEALRGEGCLIYVKVFVMEVIEGF